MDLLVGATGTETGDRLTTAWSPAYVDTIVAYATCMSSHTAVLCAPSTAAVAAPAVRSVAQPVLWRERCWTPAGVRTPLGYSGQTLATIDSVRCVHRLGIRHDGRALARPRVEISELGTLTRLILPESERLAYLAALHTRPVTPYWSKPCAPAAHPGTVSW